MLTAEKDKEISELKIKLDEHDEWFSIKKISALSGLPTSCFDWRLLKKESMYQCIPIKKVADVNYGKINAYHRSVIERIYPEAFLFEKDQDEQLNTFLD